MTDDRIKEIAHRKAWRYKHSTNPHHSDTYTFNDMCLIDFARAVIEAECRVPDGWQLVPMEPTASQLDVAVSFALNVKLCNDYNWSAYMRDVYARMLAAAPKPDPERKHEIVPTLAEPSEYAKAFQDMITHGCSFMKDGMRIPPEDVIEPAEPDCECGAVASEHCPACEPVAQEPTAFLIEGFDGNGKRVAAVIQQNADNARNSASVFAEHYPSVKTSGLYLAPPDQSAEVSMTPAASIFKDEVARLNAEVDRLRGNLHAMKQNALRDVERIAELERQQAVLVEALEKLARLGNGEHYGNSEGNCIAIAALASVKGNAIAQGREHSERPAGAEGYTS